MAAPVINPITSVQSKRTLETFELIMAASDYPVRWDASGLPSGLALDAVPTLYPATSAVSSTTDVITSTGHPFVNGDKVFFTDLTGGSGLVVNKTYWARDVVAGVSLKLASAAGATAINFTTDITAANLSKVQLGRISGAATTAGVTTANLTAMNETGTSAAVAITFGIAAGGVSLISGAELTWDLDTNLVGLKSGGAAASGEEPLITFTEGDDRLLFVRMLRGDTVLDLGAPGSFKFSLKKEEPESLIVSGGGTPTGANGSPAEKTGSGTTAVYVAAVTFTSDALAAELAESEANLAAEDTGFIGLAQFELVETNPTSSPRIGPATLTRTSRSFRVRIVRDLE